MARHSQVSLPFSDLSYEIAKILEKCGFVEKITKVGRKINRFIEITLKYEEEKSAIAGLERISKPGQRIYCSAREIRKVKDGYGIAIISTSKGLMTDKEAKKQNLGGEIICEIW